MKLARKRYGTMRLFTDHLCEAIGWPSLSVAAVYAWEAGTTRIPAVALVAAAELARVPTDHLLECAARGDEELRPYSAAGDALAAKVGRLEERIERLERTRL